MVDTSNPILTALSTTSERLNLGMFDLINRALVSSGVIFFDGVIANEECECGQSGFSDLCRDFLFLHIANMKLEPGDRRPIWIVLNSPGGSVHDGLGFYDLIRNSVEGGLQVNVLGMGTVASVATVIMQAGVKRFSFPNTQFLIHEVSQSIYSKGEKVSEGEERIEETKRMNLRVMGIIAERTGMDLQELMKLSKKKEFWLDALAAKKFGPKGLIDEVVNTIPLSF